MSRFYHEDVVALKEDSSILGEVHLVWGDIESGSHDGERDFYFHRSCPTNVKRSWFRSGELLPGYLLLEFNNACEGFCLINENAVQLVDRSFAVDDVVKKTAGDFQSGAIISASMSCGIQPVCTETQFIMAARGEEPGPLAPAYEVSAADLEYYGSHREEDFVIFRDWIGQIDSIEEEVSVRLGNGSVVVVHDPHELQEVCFEKGSASLKLHERLLQLGFSASHEQRSKVSTMSADGSDYCHSGMFVETKKANLRLGRWRYGAYNPNVEPKGIVVESRCVEIHVDWLFPNIFLERNSRTPPSETLNTDEIYGGELHIYDRSRLSANTMSSQLPNATFSVDTSWASFVKLRRHIDSSERADSRRMATQSGHQDAQSIPRTKTQGYDMNICQVKSTATTVRVRWQDGTISDEKATSLISYDNIDDHDAWPGEKVSYRPDEEVLLVEGMKTYRRTRKVGVVQTIDSKDRMARVRWYQDPYIEFDMGGGDVGACKFGPIGDNVTSVSSYELNTLVFPLQMVSRGKMVFILPDPPFINAADCKRYNDLTVKIFERKIPAAIEASGITSGSEDDLDEDSLYYELAGSCVVQATQLWGQPGSLKVPESVEDIDPERYAGRNETINCFGEVVELCLDGDVIVRLGVSSDAREVKIATERVFVVANGDSRDMDSDFGDLDEESEWEDEVSGSEASEDTTESPSTNEMSESTSSREAGRASVADAAKEHGGDVDVWETDAESSASDDQSVMDHHAEQPLNHSETEDRVHSLDQPEPSLSRRTFPNMPDSFAILDSVAPFDHFMFSNFKTLTGEQMRRISKDYRTLATSLPEGVFARSWEQRLDLLRVLIVGPSDTPYEHAPFVFDIYLGSPFPAGPPGVFFHSWSANSRVNPNLYEEGKVCLSLLGTWESENDSDAWSEKSTLLQIIISIMGLVLVREPYYSECHLRFLPILLLLHDD